MKTIEEKARAYDEALEQARDELKTCGSMDCDAARQIFRFFPELEDSEDERIRKWLIKTLKGLCNSPIEIDGSYEMMLPAIAYLERQKVNTEGDFARGYNCGYENCLNSHGAEWFEKQKEQKPDDLSLDKLVEFFEKTAKQYDINLPHRGYDIYHLCKDLYSFIYTYLPVPKQKPVEWSEKDESILNNIVAYRYLNVDDLEWIKELPKRFSIQPKQEWSDEDEGIRKALVEYFSQPEDIDTIQGVRIEKVRAWLEKQKEQKPQGVYVDCTEHPEWYGMPSIEQKPAEWSEEETDFELRLMDCMSAAQQYSHEIEWDVVKMWAKELSELRPQPKQEWGEEDENKIESIKCLITTGRFVDTSTIQTIWNILDDLRPSWKPSEEQMNRLSSTIAKLRNDGFDYMAENLESIRDGLKKL